MSHTAEAPAAASPAPPLASEPAARGRFCRWLDDRTGYRRLRDVLLVEHIPGGARWRYVWGSCLAFIFSVQLITGILLMTAYSPSDTTAWASVYFIQYQMDFGWLIRGLHHFGSQTMVILLGLHMLQVVIAGAHLPPREVNWWLGLGLLGGVLGLSLTGYLLPWDQKGYWATQVATNIAGTLPGMGPWLQKVIVGGPVYGNHTLTRFYAMHVGLLPPLVIVLTIAHLAVFRRHGVTAPRGAVGEGWFWPDQAFRDMVVSLIIFAVMLSLVLYGFGHPMERLRPRGAVHDGLAARAWEHVAHAGRDGLGANLDAPADPGRSYPARPEWYFLFLFQLLKYFEGHLELVGTVLVPTLAGAVLFLVPLVGRGRMRRVGHVFGVIVVAGLLAGIGVLTGLAIAEDHAATAAARKFRDELQAADAAAKRAIDLAASGIPVEGPVNLLRRDPKTQGPALFDAKCAGCHTFGKLFTKGEKASDLEGFGGRDWIRGLLTEPSSPRFFGHTKLTRMTKWVQEELADLEPAEATELDRIADWLATHPRNVPDDTSDLAKGYAAFSDRCMECHTFKGDGGTNIKAPDFTGYGSEDWIRAMVMSPDHPSRYGAKNAMPIFRAVSGPDADVIIAENAGRTGGLVALDDAERELIIRWLAQDYRVVFGGEPITDQGR